MFTALEYLIYRAIKNGNAEGATKACRALIKEALALMERTVKAQQS